MLNWQHAASAYIKAIHPSIFYQLSVSGRGGSSLSKEPSETNDNSPQSWEQRGKNEKQGSNVFLLIFASIFSSMWGFLIYWEYWSVFTSEELKIKNKAKKTKVKVCETKVHGSPQDTISLFPRMLEKMQLNVGWCNVDLWPDVSWLDFKCAWSAWISLEAINQDWLQ